MSGLEVRSLYREFTTGHLLSRSKAIAVDDVSLAVHAGEVVALVGESGSGKTTIGRIMVGLLEPTSGQVVVNDVDLETMSATDRRALRRDVQMVFQNTQNAFNPRRRVVQILSDPLRIHKLASGPELREHAAELFRQVGLEPAMLDRFPHEFSGGQRQRINIARALSLSPSYLVADEPVSALDVSVQAQILNLLARLRSERGMGMLFVSHDMRAVSFLSDRIAVLYRGRLVELGSRDDVLERPAHPYTRALIDAVPAIGGGRSRLERVASIGEAEGSVGSEGCNFRDRCPLRAALGNPELCETVRPPSTPVALDHQAACHFVDEGAVIARASSGGAAS
jgi:oligopeptide/dipeptide ABC transporter ATP-binding protein